MAKVLVADDEHAICEAFAQLLELEGHEALLAANGVEAVELAQTERPDAAFLDIQMPGMTGLEVLKTLHSQQPDLPVIVMTAYGTMQTAMQALKLGAFDYLGKPVELAQIRGLLQRALHQPAAAEAGAPASAEHPGDELVGRSPAMQEVFKLMSLLTGNDLTVLLTGESGVGKELVARGIHANSVRADRPFIAVNCAAIPEQLIESELFGHEKGSFTGADSKRIGRFEAAADGTLFLDEIGELPLHLQSKLLRVLQERSFERVGSVTPISLRARIIAATNRDLSDAVEDGVFRDDLYHRLKLVTLEIPPLRARRDDIELLAQHFLRQATAELGKPVTGIEPAALQELRQHHWPGNVRELEHAVKRAALSARGGWISVHDLSLEQPSNGGLADERPRTLGLQAVEDAARTVLATLVEQPADCSRSPFRDIVKTTERALIDEALRRTHGNQVAAARLLGLHRTTLRKKLSED